MALLAMYEIRARINKGETIDPADVANLMAHYEHESKENRNLRERLDNALKDLIRVRTLLNAFCNYMKTDSK